MFHMISRNAEMYTWRLQSRHSRSEAGAFEEMMALLGYSWLVLFPAKVLIVSAYVMALLYVYLLFINISKKWLRDRRNKRPVYKYKQNTKNLNSVGTEGRLLSPNCSQCEATMAIEQDLYY